MAYIPSRGGAPGRLARAMGFAQTNADSPGTGKTTVALRMATMLHQLGYLEHGHLVHALRRTTS